MVAPNTADKPHMVVIEFDDFAKLIHLASGPPVNDDEAVFMGKMLTLCKEALLQRHRQMGGKGEGK